MVRLPATKELYNPTLQALHNLGGSGTIHQINAEVAKLLQLAGKQRRGHRVRLHRARSHLEIYGLLENPRTRFWVLTAAGQNTGQVDPDDVQRVRRQSAEQGIQEKNDSLVSGEATAIFDGDEETEMTKRPLPTYQEMINPTLQALHNLGGSGKKADVSNNVVKILQLTDEQLGIRYGSGSSVFSNLLNSVRLYLVKVGLLESPSRGVWTLTEKGRSTRWVNPDEVGQTVQQMRKEQERGQKQKQQKKSVSLFSGEATAIFDGDKATEMIRDTIPTISELYNPALEALHNLGGSGTNEEIRDEVVKILNLTVEQVELLHRPGESRQAVFAGRLANARTDLKRVRLLNNPRVGGWVLTEKGRSTRQVDPGDVRRTVLQMRKEQKVQEESVSLFDAKDADDSLAQPEELSVEDLIASLSGWRDELSDILYGMSPTAFERFFLRIFRESGIGKVEVTGSSGDDTIEGMMASGGFLSLRVLFRCMRGNRLINKDEVADFRRAVSLGRANKGVLVTTGNFTQEAMREASRNSAPEIDLMDGERLIDKLKELSLGVKTEKVVVERVIIDRDWFQNIQL